MSLLPLSRRGLVLAGVVGGAFALSGCSWTPRNAGSQQAAESSQASSSSDAGSQASSSSDVGATKNAPAVDDGLTLVHGGTFTMGSPTDEPWRSDDEVQHEVAVSDFYLAPTEVSELEFNTLMGRGAAVDGIPVAHVSWYDAVAYCNALSAEASTLPLLIS